MADNESNKNDWQTRRQRDLEEEAEYWRTYQGKGRCLLVLLVCAATGGSVVWEAIGMLAQHLR